MKIRIGIGTDGEILEDYEKAKACNFCTKFRGRDSHWFFGYCIEKNKELCYKDYSTEAKQCNSFDCNPKYIRI